MNFPYIGNVDILAALAAFSLAWFILGLLVGQRRASVVVSNGKRGRRSGKNSVEIYVGNLSYDVRERDLRKTFEKYGYVAGARIIKNTFNGKSKGFGFVEMTNRGESNDAIRALNGTEIKGRRVVVNEAKSRSRDD